jgi:hypothetical protein
MAKKERRDRVLIVFDGAAWFVRRVRLVEHDLHADEMVYRCDQPLAGPMKLVDAIRVVDAGVLPRTPVEEAAGELLAALKALRRDAWRHTVDWGSPAEREAIEAQCDAAIAKAEKAAA